MDAMEPFSAALFAEKEELNNDVRGKSKVIGQRYLEISTNGSNSQEKSLSRIRGGELSLCSQAIIVGLSMGNITEGVD